MQQKVGIRRREKSCLTRAAAAARRGGGATNPAVSGTNPTHSSGRRRWSAAAATPSGSTASRAQQPRHRNAAGEVMRRSEARGLGGAHACRRRDCAGEVTSRSVAEEPTMFSSRESEKGSPGHDALVRGARGVQGGGVARTNSSLESLWTTGHHPQMHRQLKAGRRVCRRELLEASAQPTAFSPGRAKGAVIVVGCFYRELRQRGCRAGV